jgi:hypothetical protein
MPNPSDASSPTPEQNATAPDSSRSASSSLRETLPTSPPATSEQRSSTTSQRTAPSSAAQAPASDQPGAATSTPATRTGAGGTSRAASTGSASTPEANADSGPVIVVAGARGALEELKQALDLAGKGTPVIAVNDVGTVIAEPLRAWVTLHKDSMPAWLDARRRAGLADPKDIVFHSEGPGTNEALGNVAPTRVIDHMFSGQAKLGSSGLFGVKVALVLGFDKVIVCGAPMTREGGHYFSEGSWNDADTYFEAWPPLLPRLKDQVRSMSGRTRELFGEPSKNWLDS